MPGKNLSPTALAQGLGGEYPGDGQSNSSVQNHTSRFVSENRQRWKEEEPTACGEVSGKKRVTSTWRKELCKTARCRKEPFVSRSRRKH